MNAPVSRVHLDQAIHDNLGRLSFMDSDVKSYTTRYPDAEQARLSAVSALHHHQDFLEKTLPTRATHDWRLGGVLYAKKFPLALQTDLTPEELTARARAAFHQARHEAEEIAVRLGRGYWPKEASPQDAQGRAQLLKRVRDEVSKEHPAPDALVKVSADCIGALRAFVQGKNLLALPPEDTLAVPACAGIQTWAPLARSIHPRHAGPSGAHWQGVYYVDPVDPSLVHRKKQEELPFGARTTTHEIEPHRRS